MTTTLLEHSKANAANKDPTNEINISKTAKDLADALSNLLASLGAGYY